MTTTLEKGIALGKANRRKEAIEYLKQALLENPREVEAWMWIAQLVDGDRPTQKYCYKKILEIEPNHYVVQTLLRFLEDTDANIKFFPDPTSPLQTFFESQQDRQPQIQTGKPFSAPAARPNPNIRPITTHTQNSRSPHPQSRPKKKRISPWISSFLVFTVLIVIVSIILPLISIPFLPYILFYLQSLDPSLSTLSIDDLATGGVILAAWYIFNQLFIVLLGLYWIASGYVGAFFLLKKGYILELVGCAILAAGVPLVLPAVLGPIMYWWGNSVQEKNR